jgi:hypothetical protein
MNIYYETDSISHHGIKGQKWGVRRFQNKDGTLTAKGKKRYKTDYDAEAKTLSDDELRRRISRLTNEKKYMDLTKKESKFISKIDKLDKKANISSKSAKVRQNIANIKGNKQLAAKYGTTVKAFDAVSKSASLAKKVNKMATEPEHVKKARKELKNIRDEDLKKLVDRMDLERQYSQISKETSRRGKITSDQILDVIGDAVTIVASVTGIVVGIKALENMKNGSGLPL